MKKEITIFVVLFAILFGLTPVGLCPCWLNPDFVKVHPHISNPGKSHSHDYLSEMSEGAAFAIASLILAPSLALLFAFLDGEIWKTLSSQVIVTTPWCERPKLRPPRARMSKHHRSIIR